MSIKHEWELLRWMDELPLEVWELVPPCSTLSSIEGELEAAVRTYELKTGKKLPRPAGAIANQQESK
jgi:hypothetical protein